MDFIKTQIINYINNLRTKNVYIYSAIVGIAAYMIVGIPYLQSQGVSTPSFILTLRPYFLMFSSIFSFDKLVVTTDATTTQEADEEFTTTNK